MKRDGPFCQRCAGAVLNPLTDLTINHIDHDKTNNHRWNLNLMHFGCQITEFLDTSDESTGKRARISRDVGSESEVTSVEIERNEEGEPAVREFVVEHLLRYGPNPPESDIQFLRLRVVLAAASNYAGPNPKTCYPYFNRMTNPINGFIELKKHPQLKVGYLTFRFPEYYDMTVEEILEINPKKGLRFRQDQLRDQP